MTDPRLSDIKPYLDDEALASYRHREVKDMLKHDIADFIKRPTQANLSCAVSLMLTFQDSTLLGRSRKAAGDR